MKPRDQIIARMYVVLTLLGILPVMVVWQILGIDIADGPELREKGVMQASSVQSIPAVRGTIYDRAGRTLAVNTTRFDVGVDPTSRGFAEGAERLYATLERLTGRSASSFRERVRTRSSRQYALLVRDLSEQQMDRIRALEIPGLVADPTFARRYNYQSTMAHVLGHVDTDLHGIAGVEQEYDAYLTGTPGKRIRKRDRRGVLTAFVGSKDVEPNHGESIVLTIDLVRQAIVEEELARGVEEAGATWGSAIAMNPHTGEILAMTNAPTYDPNRPGAFSTSERRNRAVADQIEPGSTFKLVAAVTALEEGVASLEDSVDTGNGHARFGGRSMHDTHAHGVITIGEAIAVSSNIGIAKTAQKIDPGDLYQHARDLGFGQPTYIDIPGEATGLLKRPADWSGTSRTSISIGYEVMVTPLQMLAAYAALANDGLLVQPHVVKERRSFDGEVLWRAEPDSIRRAFKRRTAKELVPAFEQVILNGTAKDAAIEGIRVAGKTGTANKIVNGVYTPRVSRATFVGFFPVEDPQVVLIVVMDEPRKSTYGGVVAAPVFRRIASRWIPTMPEIADFIEAFESDPAPVARTVPSVEGKPVSIAAAQLEAAGFDVKFPDETPEALVSDQNPDAGATARSRDRIVLVSSEESTTNAEVTKEEVKMPDLSGLGVRQAVYWLSSQGISAKIEGKGKVIKQYPAAGKSVARQATLVAR